MRLTIIPFALCLLLPALARAESLYVACDNGLDCVMAPCPSTTVRDLAAGSDRKGVYPDIGGLSESDQKRIRDADALYYGRLVLRGRVFEGNWVNGCLRSPQGWFAFTRPAQECNGLDT